MLMNSFAEMLKQFVFDYLKNDVSPDLCECSCVGPTEEA